MNSTERRRLVHGWADDGFIDNHSGLGDVSATLTPTGREHVLARRRQRDDVVLRRTATQNGLLRALYDADPAGARWTELNKLLSTIRFVYEGAEISDDEVHLAAESLQRNGLIDGDDGCAEFRGPTMMQLSETGQECIKHWDGDVARYLRDHHNTGITINNRIGTIHNTGAAMAIGSSDVTLNVKADVDPTAMAAFVQMLLRELPNLQLGADREAAAGTALARPHRTLKGGTPTPAPPTNHRT